MFHGKRIFAMFVTTLTALAFAACHTVEGAGKDIESAGDKVEEVTRN